jgi:folate-binding Fe-S cluster repair protein YgfZ
MPLPPTLRSLLRTTPTVAPVPHRGVLSISGSQATEFLHGIVAGTVHQPAKRPFYSAFLHAQARHNAFKAMFSYVINNILLSREELNMMYSSTLQPMQTVARTIF